MPTTKRRLILPKNEISYFQNGRVKSVVTYTNVNDWTIADHTYERIGGLFLESAFDEHHEVSYTRKQVFVQNLPEYVRQLFGAKSIEDVQKMREERKLPLKFVDVYPKNTEKRTPRRIETESPLTSWDFFTS